MIKRNAVHCLICDTVVESKHRHDFKYCKCENVFVDGGLDYFRCGVKDPENVVSLYETEEEETEE